MTRVTVLRDETDGLDVTYRAVGGHLQAAGRTAGEAVDALASRLPDDEAGTLILVRELRPDRFFSAEQRLGSEDGPQPPGTGGCQNPWVQPVGSGYQNVRETFSHSVARIRGRTPSSGFLDSFPPWR